MARTAIATAKALLKIYDEDFRNDIGEIYRISWPQLRLVAGVPKLDREYISAVNKALHERNYTLIPFDDYLVVAQDIDFDADRQVPDRIIENYIESPEIELDESDEELENDDVLEHG